MKETARYRRRGRGGRCPKTWADLRKMLRRTYKSKARSIKVSSSSPVVKHNAPIEKGSGEWGGEKNVQPPMSHRIITQAEASGKPSESKPGKAPIQTSKASLIQSRKLIGKPPSAPPALKTNPASKQPVLKKTKKPLLLQDKTNAQSVQRHVNEEPLRDKRNVDKSQKLVLATSKSASAPKSLSTLPPNSKRSATSSLSHFPLSLRSLGQQQQQELPNGRKRHKAHRPVFLPQQSKKPKKAIIENDPGPSFQVYKDPVESIEAETAVVQDRAMYIFLFNTSMFTKPII